MLIRFNRSEKEEADGRDNNFFNNLNNFDTQRFAIICEEKFMLTDVLRLIRSLISNTTTNFSLVKR